MAIKDGKFVPRQRKQKHRELARNQKRQSNPEDADAPNEEVILPEHVKEQQERKARMRQELVDSQGIKVSGKKAKRLDKYIDNKLKKDETRELLAKLAKTKVDTSLFASSRALGHNRETKREGLIRAMRERKAGIGAEEDEDLLFEHRKPDYSSDDAVPTVLKAAPPAKASPKAATPVETSPKASSQSKQSDEIEGVDIVAEVERPVMVESKPAISAPVSIGAGLKRPLDLGDDGRPKLAKRQKRGGVKSRISLVQPSLPAVNISAATNDETSGEEWNGFSADESSEGGEESGGEESGEEESGEEESGEEESGEESGEEESEDDSSSEDDSDDENPRKPSVSAFKAWAQEKRNQALGHEPANADGQILHIPKPKGFVPRAIEQDPLPAELQPTKDNDRKAYSVAVSRLDSIQEARLKLPVVAEEQKIMEAIHNNDIVVLCGATGSGKTTQVPQFLFEAGYGSTSGPTPGLIGITQPRRVAAVSMSKRVAEELGSHSDKVAYQIRFEGTVKPGTAVKFMTDGVLLREVAQDILLKKYSAVIVDEAHERSVNTDILVGLLSRAVKLRREMSEEKSSTTTPLKLIIMSATLRIEDMTQNPKLFKNPPPVLVVEGRQFPVTIHFSRRTHHDYVEEAFKKISRGHKKLPPGAILVFMTGQDEITQLSKKLKKAFTGMDSGAVTKVRIPASEAPMEAEDIELGNMGDDGLDDYEDDVSGDEAEDETEFDIPAEEGEAGTGPSSMHILPLYSLLPTREQMRVFEPPPNGSRLVVLATNVAETSLTIPGIRYVFDCGRSKERKYDRLTSVQTFQVGWISKASASQRSGRAGRTGPGHCYRLYSSAVYERDFQEFSEPELLRQPLEGVVLQLKAMKLHNVVNFPFPTPPDRQSLLKAERLLTYLGAINKDKQITPIGETMNIFPLAPRFARILLIGHLHGCLPYTVAMVSGLSASGEVFIPHGQAIPQLAAKEDENGEPAFRGNAEVLAETHQANVRREYNKVHKDFCAWDDNSDAMKLLKAVQEFSCEPTEEWCEAHFVRYKILKEIQQLRSQITQLLRTHMSAPVFHSPFEERLVTPPNAKQVTALKQMVAAGFINHVAIRADKAPTPLTGHRKPTRAIDVPYLPLEPLTTTSAELLDRAVFIHPESPLAHLSAAECPEYVVYSYLQRGQASGVEGERTPKTRMHALTDVTGGQVWSIAKSTPLISYGKPIKVVEEREGGKVRDVLVVPYFRAEGTTGMGWPLPARKITQRRVTGKGWVVE